MPEIDPPKIIAGIGIVILLCACSSLASGIMFLTQKREDEPIKTLGPVSTACGVISSIIAIGLLGFAIYKIATADKTPKID